MANQITGRIIKISPTVQIPSKAGGNPFIKRELLIDATTYDPYTGERNEYENIIPLEFSGEKCTELDHFNNGDIVTVSFALQGRSWKNTNGEIKQIASIRCYKIEIREGVHQPLPVSHIQQSQQGDNQHKTPNAQTAEPDSDLPF